MRIHAIPIRLVGYTQRTYSKSTWLCPHSCSYKGENSCFCLPSSSLFWHYCLSNALSVPGVFPMLLPYYYYRGNRGERLRAQTLEAVCLGSDLCSTTKELWNLGQVTETLFLTFLSRKMEMIIMGWLWRLDEYMHIVSTMCVSCYYHSHFRDKWELSRTGGFKWLSNT